MKELYYEDNHYKLASHKVTYGEENELVERYTDNPAWFEEFRKLHGGMRGLSVEQVSYSEKQVSRLEECKNFPPSAEEDVYNYVLLGVVNADSPLFKTKVDEDRLEAMESALLEILLGGAM